MQHFDRKCYRKIALAIVALVCFSIACAFFFPGLGDGDTETIILDALTGNYRTWHSAFLEFLLHEAIKALPRLRPYDILFLAAMAQYWAAHGIVARVYMLGLWRQCLFVVMSGFFLPAFLLMLSMNKDSLLCASLLLSYSLLLLAECAHSKVKKTLFCAIASVFLFVATSERHNVFFATIPFCFWLVSILSHTFRLLPARLGRAHSLIFAVLGIALTISLCIIVDVIENKFLNSVDGHPVQMLLTWDLVSISALSGDVCFPDNYANRGVPRLSYLKSLYCEYCADTIFFWQGDVPLLPLVHTQIELHGLEQSWLHATFKHPAEYLNHRTKAWLSLIGAIDTDSQIIPYLFLAEDHPARTMESLYRNSLLGLSIHRIVPMPHALHIPHYLTRAWFYVLGLVLWYVLYKFKLIRIARGENFLVASALFYSAGFYFCISSSNQRFMTYPICVYAIIMVRLLLSSRTWHSVFSNRKLVSFGRSMFSRNQKIGSSKSSKSMLENQQQ